MDSLRLAAASVHILRPLHLISGLLRRGKGQEVVYDVRCPLCQSAPGTDHAEGYECAPRGKWFGTSTEYLEMYPLRGTEN